MGASWGPLGPSWDLLGASWEPLGLSWEENNGGFGTGRPFLAILGGQKCKTAHRRTELGPPKLDPRGGGRGGVNPSPEVWGQEEDETSKPPAPRGLAGLKNTLDDSDSNLRGAFFAPRGSSQDPTQGIAAAGAD